MPAVERRKRLRAFTLVELLVVIAIIGVMVALLLPAIQAAREAARRMSCGNNLKQLGLALQVYHASYRAFPPGVVGDDAAKYGGNFNQAYRGFAWGAFILPFLEEKPLHDRIDFGTGAVAMPGWPPASNYNEDLLTQAPLTKFLCPSDPRRPQDGDYFPAPNMGASSYVGNFGTNAYILSGNQNVSWLSARKSAGWVSSLTPTGYMNVKSVGPFCTNSRVALRDIVDGTSNTVFLGERRGDLTRAVPMSMLLTAGQTFWAYGSMHSHVLSSSYFRPNKCGRKTPQPDLDGCVGTFSSLHPGGLQVCLMDGSVRFISDTIDSAEEADVDAISDIKSPGNVYAVWQAICVINDGIVVSEF